MKYSFYYTLPVDRRQLRIVEEYDRFKNYQLGTTKPLSDYQIIDITKCDHGLKLSQYCKQCSENSCLNRGKNE